MPIRILVAESEPPPAREKRRASVGKSSGETFVETLRRLAPGAAIAHVRPVDSAAELKSGDDLAGFDAVFLTGSPLHLYQDRPEVRLQVEFMRALFASGTPSFGSCAGLQVATVAAGGTVRPLGDRREAGFARAITPTREGIDHPLLAGRPPAFDAVAIHTDEVATLPEGSTLLATSRAVRVQAVEIRHDRGIFWGVQYHPELPLSDVAAALRRQSDELIDTGLARSDDDVEAHAGLIDALAHDTGRRDLAWRLGLDDQITARDNREQELRNFLERLVPQIARERGR